MGRSWSGGDGSGRIRPRIGGKQRNCCTANSCASSTSPPLYYGFDRQSHRVAGTDTLYLSDTTFELLKPASTVDLVVRTPARTSALKPPIEVTVKLWTVGFVGAFMRGAPIDWKAYDLATLTQGASSGERPLPEDYRTLADQFIRDYRQIWRNVLIIPGKMGDAEWATPPGRSPTDWF